MGENEENAKRLERLMPGNRLFFGGGGGGLRVLVVYKRNGLPCLVLQFCFILFQEISWLVTFSVILMITAVYSTFLAFMIIKFDLNGSDASQILL